MSELYRELSQPFSSLEAGREAVAEFFKELTALREKHKLPDVHVVVAYSVHENDGEALYSSDAHCGDVHCAAPMLAYALGRAIGTMTRNLQSLVAQGAREE